MRRRVPAVLFVLGALWLMAVPAQAKTDHVLKGCKAAAGAFYDESGAGSSKVPTALGELGTSKNKKLRAIVAAIAADEKDGAAVGQLGSYCRLHYRKNRAILASSFVAATTTTTSTTTTTTTTSTTTTQPPPPPPTTAPPETGCPNGTYVNSAGNTVCSPYNAPSAPAGATAQCRDGTWSFSQSRSGTCSSHGGVDHFL